MKRVILVAALSLFGFPAFAGDGLTKAYQEQSHMLMDALAQVRGQAMEVASEAEALKAYWGDYVTGLSHDSHKGK